MKIRSGDVAAETLRRALMRALCSAGDVLRGFSRRPIAVTLKGPVNPVTAADRAAEKKIVKILRGRFPEHGFLTEESPPRRTASPYRWVVDPLDGTVNYAHGVPHACVSIAVEKNGRVLMGGILDPFRRELFFAARGRGSRLNGRPIRVSRKKRLIESLLVTGFPYDRYKKSRYYLRFYNEFMKRTQGLRRFGAAALDMAYVAAGRFDGYWEFNLKPWDSAAGWVLVEEAGGRVSDFRGTGYSLADTRQTLCSNGFLHDAMRKILRTGASGL
ncbi:MAG TPA: inositol monophosphatase family protein [Elusimicrobiota bacterium]|nr:inositol monophosphatase family protein [Elusimicrobiota bacterium]